MEHHEPKYHIGFSREDLGEDTPTFALLCGDPERAARIALETDGVRLEKVLSERRGLNSYLVSLPGGRRVVSATSGMGAPSLSIVVNELYAVGIRQILRIGTSGSIQRNVKVGSIVITRAALCRQGAAADIAPLEYPAAANPFVTAALVQAARELQVDWHLGVTASVDTFYEGQERMASSANPHLQRWLGGISLPRELLRHLGVPRERLEGVPQEGLRVGGITEEYRGLNVLNYEMESGTLLKMSGVYGFAGACVCAVVADRTTSEHVARDLVGTAEANAIQVALRAVEILDPEYLKPRYWG